MYETPPGTELTEESDAYDNMLVSKVVSESENASQVEEVIVDFQISVRADLPRGSTEAFTLSNYNNVFDSIFSESDKYTCGGTKIVSFSKEDGGVPPRGAFRAKYTPSTNPETVPDSAVSADRPPSWIDMNQDIWIVVDAFVNVLLELPNGSNIWVNKKMTDLIDRDTNLSDSVASEDVSDLSSLLQAEESETLVTVSLVGRDKVNIETETASIDCNRGRKDWDTQTTEEFDSFLVEYLKNTTPWCSGRLGTVRYEENEGVSFIPVHIGGEEMYFRFVDVEGPEESLFWEIVDEFGGGDPLQVDGEMVEIAFEPVVWDTRVLQSDTTICKYGLWVIREKTHSSPSVSDRLLSIF